MSKLCNGRQTQLTYHPLKMFVTFSNMLWEKLTNKYRRVEEIYDRMPR